MSERTGKQSEISSGNDGRAVVKWENTKIGDVIFGKPSYGINAPACSYSVGLPQYIRITDITDQGYYSQNDVAYINSERACDYFLCENDIVLARTGASVGKSYLYDKNDGVLVYAGFLIKISPDVKKVVPKYLFECLHTKRYWNWVQSESMRSGQPGINGEQYASFEIPLPPIHEQRAIATVLSDTDELIAALEKLIAKKTPSSKVQCRNF
jgi:type I restriction enzyme S subunit